MIGIYKITNPNNRVYIGQSINIEKRWLNYKRSGCKTQQLLSRSFNKYGVKNHTFEILHLCNIEDLNIFERYYQDLFEVIGKYGLNLLLTKTKVYRGRFSQIAKDTVSAGMRGRKLSESTKQKISNSHKNKIVTIDTKKKQSLIKLGKKLSETHRLNIANAKNASKKVIDCSTNIVYNSIKEASEYLGISASHLRNQLTGRKTNKTTFKYFKKL